MSSIGTDLKLIMELAPLYSRLSTPAMRARDEACRSLQRELRDALTLVPTIAVGSELDVAVGGHQGYYGPLAWVRIYSRKHSPNATAGIYLAYLFAVDGQRAYLSLQQGSSEIRAGNVRPVNDIDKLLDDGAAARSAIQDLIESPLAAGTTISMDLAWRERSVSSYSRRRVQNYEYANILAIEYDSYNVPANDILLADLYRMLTLLMELYGDAVLTAAGGLVSRDIPASGAAGTDAARIQGLLRETAVRRAVEIYAEDHAESYLQKHGWTVERVGSQKLGYDLKCINQQGGLLHVEVKGTQSLGEEVFLTRNEVLHNGPQAECGAEHALFVLSRIEVSDTVGIECSGGSPDWIWQWTVDQKLLTPTEYTYRVPNHG